MKTHSWIATIFIAFILLQIPIINIIIFFTFVEYYRTANKQKQHWIRYWIIR